MTQYLSHREILELWRHVPTTGQQSWCYALAIELQRHLKVTVTYWMVRRWWDRSRIPVEYHSALVAAASRRGFRGVTHKALADISARELIKLVHSEPASAA